MSETLNTKAPKENVTKLPGSKVKLAFLHQAVTVPGVIGSEKTLSEAKVKGIQMTWSPQVLGGLLIKAKGSVALIPAANVAVCVLEEG